MDAQGNGLSLEGLAKILETQTQRLETLERENERMHSVNAELQHKVATLEGSGTRRNEVSEMRGSEVSLNGQPVSVLDGRLSRRSLLSKAGAAAVAAVAAGTLLNPREASAEHGGPGIEVDYVWAHSDQTTAVKGIAAPSGGNHGVYGESATAFTAILGRNIRRSGGGTGVEGRSDNGTGVFGAGRSGVEGLSNTSGWAGVYGTNSTGFGFGVVGDGKGEAGAGVLGRNQFGTGVHGQSSKAGYGGVTAEHTGDFGYGVIGLGKGEGGAGVLGRSASPNGQGVRGESQQGAIAVYGKSTDGIGVSGVTTGIGNPGVYGRNLSGYGGRFFGGKAQLKLDPTGDVGHPTFGTHSKGEIYLDKNAQLFICTEGDGTTVGTWRMVRTVAT